MTTTRFALPQALDELHHQLALVVDAARPGGLEVLEGEVVVESAVSIEAALRRLEAVKALLCADTSRRQEKLGRSVGSAATALSGRLGITVGNARGAVLAGKRVGTPGMDALTAGQITVAQERAVAEAIDCLPDGVDESVARGLADELVDKARGGMGPGRLGAEGHAALNRLDPTRAARVEERQQEQRSLRNPVPGPDGMSSIGLRCEPRLRALLDAVLARWARPGECLGGSDPASRAALAAGDTRSTEQRAYDALCHVLTLGLGVDPAVKGRAPASIIVRVTPDQLDSPGAVVTGHAGTALTVSQAMSMAGDNPWFLSLLRDGREELHRIDVDTGNAGGTRRTGTRIQRMVLYAAHGGCTYPGCQVPAARCEFHHVRDYCRGGPTTVANGALNCPSHHGWIGGLPHQWQTLINPDSPGRPTWIPPGTDRLAA